MVDSNYFHIDDIVMLKEKRLGDENEIVGYVYSIHPRYIRISRRPSDITFWIYTVKIPYDNMLLPEILKKGSKLEEQVLETSSDVEKISPEVGMH